ncbi:MAG: anti-sigma factor [Candidatus Omnitrophota bacterium]
MRTVILTDYLDGCLTDFVKAQLESHLQQCPECRELVSLAPRMLVTPFAGLPKEKMPEAVRVSIMQQVRARQSSSVGASWRHFVVEMQEGFVFPLLELRWVAAALVCVVAVGVGFGMNGLHQAKQKDQVIFLAEVAEFSVIKNKIISDYGTSMESVFLEDRGDS